jgi:hypothetical protein
MEKILKTLLLALAETSHGSGIDGNKIADARDQLDALTAPAVAPTPAPAPTETDPHGAGSN